MFYHCSERVHEASGESTKTAIAETSVLLLRYDLFKIHPQLKQRLAQIVLHAWCKFLHFCCCCILIRKYITKHEQNRNEQRLT